MEFLTGIERGCSLLARVSSQSGAFGGSSVRLRNHRGAKFRMTSQYMDVSGRSVMADADGIILA
jgi:hypothetical protein